MAYLMVASLITTLYLQQVVPELSAAGQVPMWATHSDKSDNIFHSGCWTQQAKVPAGEGTYCLLLFLPVSELISFSKPGSLK